MRRLVFASLAAALIWPTAAFACGGCFVPAGLTGTPVLQNAERILFSHDTTTKKSYVWVEIRYAGPPGDFSWVLPLPKVPDVSVGDSWLFDRLDLATAAQFQLNFDSSENCSYSSAQSSGLGCGSFKTASYDEAGSGNSLNAPTNTTGGNGVTVLKHAQVGKYDYVLVQATSKTEGAAKMLKWLNDNGYAVPDAAKPILDDHVARGDVFVALHLVSGATIKEIRPIALTMDDAEACVPLRLTSIAAVDDMDVVVTLAGAGRAIPKNHMHVVVNPARLDWFGGAANYPQVLATAIDEAAGRAFATEYAGKLPKTVTTVANMNQVTTPTFDLTALNTDLIAKATSRDAAWSQILTQKLPITQAVADVLEAHFHAAGSKDALTYYQDLQSAPGAISNPYDPVDSDPKLPTLAADLETNFCKPVRDMAQRLGSAEKVTRLVLRISPKEMQKDPVFAFSPTLPDVSNVSTAVAHGICRKGNYSIDAERLTIGTMGSWIFEFPDSSNDFAKIKSAADPRFATAPAALRVEVLDETGEPFAVKAEDVGKVDLAIASAHAGITPSLTITLDAGGDRWTAPPTDALFGTIATPTNSTSCQQGRTPAVPGGLLLLAVGAIFLVRRRRAE